MRRARDLIDRNASIQEICAAVKDDPEYVSFADQKKGGKGGRSRGGNNKRKPKPIRLKEKAEQQQAHDAENTAEPAAPGDASDGPGALADAPQLGETWRREEEVALVHAPGSAAETTQAPLESPDHSQKV